MPRKKRKSPCVKVANRIVLTPQTVISDDDIIVPPGVLSEIISGEVPAKLVLDEKEEEDIKKAKEIISNIIDKLRQMKSQLPTSSGVIVNVFLESNTKVYAVNLIKFLASKAQKLLVARSIDRARDEFGIAFEYSLRINGADSIHTLGLELDYVIAYYGDFTSSDYTNAVSEPKRKHLEKIVDKVKELLAGSYDSNELKKTLAIADYHLAQYHYTKGNIANACVHLDRSESLRKEYNDSRMGFNRVLFLRGLIDFQINPDSCEKAHSLFLQCFEFRKSLLGEENCDLIPVLEALVATTEKLHKLRDTVKFLMQLLHIQKAYKMDTRKILDTSFTLLNSLENKVDIEEYLMVLVILEEELNSMAVTKPGFEVGSNYLKLARSRLSGFLFDVNWSFIKRKEFCAETLKIIIKAEKHFIELTDNDELIGTKLNELAAMKEQCLSLLKAYEDPYLAVILARKKVIKLKEEDINKLANNLSEKILENYENIDRIDNEDLRRGLTEFGKKGIKNANALMHIIGSWNEIQMAENKAVVKGDIGDVTRQQLILFAQQGQAIDDSYRLRSWLIKTLLIVSIKKILDIRCASDKNLYEKIIISFDITEDDIVKLDPAYIEELESDDSRPVALKLITELELKLTTCEVEEKLDILQKLVHLAYSKNYFANREEFNCDLVNGKYPIAQVCGLLRAKEIKKHGEQSLEATDIQKRCFYIPDQYSEYLNGQWLLNAIDKEIPVLYYNRINRDEKDALADVVKVAKEKALATELQNKVIVLKDLIKLFFSRMNTASDTIVKITDYYINNEDRYTSHLSGILKLDGGSSITLTSTGKEIFYLILNGYYPCVGNDYRFYFYKDGNNEKLNEKLKHIEGANPELYNFLRYHVQKQSSGGSVISVYGYSDWHTMVDQTETKHLVWLQSTSRQHLSRQCLDGIDKDAQCPPSHHHIDFQVDADDAGQTSILLDADAAKINPVLPTVVGVEDESRKATVTHF